MVPNHVAAVCVFFSLWRGADQVSDILRGDCYPFLLAGGGAWHRGGRGWRRRGVGGWSRAAIRRVHRCGARRFGCRAGRFRGACGVWFPVSRAPAGPAPRCVPRSLCGAASRGVPRGNPYFRRSRPVWCATTPRIPGFRSCCGAGLLHNRNRYRSHRASWSDRTLMVRHDSRELPPMTVLWSTSAPQHHPRTALWSTGTFPGSKPGRPHHPGRLLPARPPLPGVRNPGRSRCSPGFMTLGETERQKSRTVGPFSRIRDAEKDSASQIPDDAARFPNPGRWGRRSGVRNPGRGRLSSGLLASGRIYRRVSSCRWWKWRHPLGEGVESRRLPARGHPPALRDNSRQQEEDGRCGSCAPSPADGRGDTRARAVWGIRTKM